MLDPNCLSPHRHVSGLRFGRSPPGDVRRRRRSKPDAAALVGWRADGRTHLVTGLSVPMPVNHLGAAQELAESLGLATGRFSLLVARRIAMCYPTGVSSGTAEQLQSPRRY